MIKKVLFIMTTLIEAAVAADVVNDATEFIAAEEGFSATPYICLGGQTTIGYGCADKAVVAKGKITKAEAKKVLKAKVTEDLAWLKRLLPKLNNNQLVAVLSLVYNIGRGRFLRSKAYQCLKAGTMLRAVNEMEEFRLVNGKVNTGLVARRQRERIKFLSVR